MGAAALDEPLRRVVGDKTAKALAKALDLHTVGELLRHYPRRYAERGDLTDLSSLHEGEHVTVLAEVVKVKGRRMKERRGYVVEATITDGRGELTLTFFNQPWREKELLPGRRGLFAGKVSRFKRRRQLAHPDFRLLDGGGDDLSRAVEYASEIIPIYPASKEMESWSIATAVRVVLDTLGPMEDPLPEEVRRRYGLVGLRDALEGIHRPRSHEEARAAKKRLKVDEAFVLQTALAQRRLAARASPAKPRARREGGLLDEFDARLPFSLTEGQRSVGELVADELADEHPMNRLLQGEVGAGKTVVALRAMLQAVDAGGQAGLLAPTEVLAQQHHRSITELLGPLAQAGQLGGAEQATRVALLTGSQGAAARREALLDAASGAAGIVVGTHALLEEHVQFADLGLVVIDEQHRFGVEQRDALREKADGGRPHILVMTATPIPRTVAMTVFGDLEVSTLTELPRGRSPIATHVVPAGEKPHYLARAWERVREEVAAGRQAYVVCPRIGEGEEEEFVEVMDPDLTAEEVARRRPPLAVLDVASMLADGPLRDLRTAVLYGRLHPDDKDAVMRRFAAGEIDVLVATTVIEVGVDVPNATVMVIMDADRFGVSQLHQLRGRVGRGTEPGLALLVTDAEGPNPARERLDAVASTTDGFVLSRLDLEQRREGDVLGEAQSGRRSSLKLLALLRDDDLIKAAREDATQVAEADPELAEHPALAAAMRDLLGQDRAEYLEKA
ncbi:MAG: ATP-dependent DNA helicase RecG [Streptosporangiales bacterium]|nr:ATP-dependent DNA helicase RecG [Streptosporangiales bacterium]